MESVLVVDDDRSSREATREFLEDAGFHVVTASSGEEARTRLTDGIAVVLTDLVMPGVSGLDLLSTARKQIPHAPVILLTGQGSEDAAVSALTSGAFHYLTKPANPEDLSNLVRQALEKYRMAGEIAKLHQQIASQNGLCRIIGSSEPMRKIFETLRMVADTRSTVLLEGESGTGKELFARALHDLSPRRKRPFVAVNCAALPEALVESELFGHKKGAFTGALDHRIGKFEAAHEGTLFIDEIGEMPIELQSKLLRALESRSITKVGDNKEIEIDTRIVAATNRNLEERIKEGLFREDLFYRLAVIRLPLPPLRDRTEDIPLLTRAFMDQIAKENHRPTREISPDALDRLKAYDWPGNVRQLRNILESVIVTNPKDVIEVADLPLSLQKKSSPTSQDASHLDPDELTLDRLEANAIQEALRRTEGNRTQASKLLGISVRTLQRKIRDDGRSDTLAGPPTT